MDNMSCQIATRVLNESIREVAIGMGEGWTRDLAVKVVGLHGMSYWDARDQERFEPDYAFLASTIRGAQG